MSAPTSSRELYIPIILVTVFKFARCSHYAGSYGHEVIPTDFPIQGLVHNPLKMLKQLSKFNVGF